MYVAARSSEHTLQALQDKIDSGLKPASLPLERIASIQTSYERKKLQGRNVIGIIPGSDARLREECIVIGAHHDHIGRQARTRKSTMGLTMMRLARQALLELAEAFQAGPLRPRRSIVLAAWGAEELGLLGSKHYALNPVFPLNKTVAMIQLDMIGRNEQRPGDTANGEPEEKEENNTNTLSIAGSAFSPDLKQWFEACNRRTGLTLRYRYDSGQENLLKRSDHWCFLKAGIPSVFLFTGFHPDYHRPSDTADKINYEKMERILRLLYSEHLGIGRPNKSTAFHDAQDQRLPKLGPSNRRTHAARQSLLPFDPGLRHNIDILDAGLLGTIHHLGNRTERDFLVGTKIDHGLLGVLDSCLEPLPQLIDIHFRVVHKELLGAIDGNHQSFLGEFFDRSAFWAR